MSKIDEISNGEVLIDFWAPWCVPCNTSKPHFEAFTAEKGITPISVNIETDEELVEKFKIRSVPTFILLKDGKEVKRYSSKVDKKVLDQEFGNLISR